MTSPLERMQKVAGRDKAGVDPELTWLAPAHCGAVIAERPTRDHIGAIALTPRHTNPNTSEDTPLGSLEAVNAEFAVGQVVTSINAYASDMSILVQNMGQECRV
jgi:hypothetical protein